MIIKKSAIGNKDEAFIESSYTNKFNIISSDDNNKGKTIVIQSLMYALGNEPTFPTTFEYKSYYHYVEFEEGDKLYYICRHNNGIILKYDTILMVFDSVSELKRYWTKHIFKLPVIVKNQIEKVVDPVLFFQLFFVGQDKKDTSNISHTGLYNKQDFYNMIFSMCDAGISDIRDTDIYQIRNRIKSLKDEKETLIKQFKILKSDKNAVSFLSTANDRMLFEKKIKEMEKIRTKIEDLRKARNRATTRKSKWETTLKELRSLNRTITHGELRCMDCNSTNISFSDSSKNASYTFDVSSVDMRNEIITSIKEQIITYDEEIDRLSFEISKSQDDLKEIMEDETITLESIVSFKEDIFSAVDAEKKIKQIEETISNLKSKLVAANNTSKSQKEKQASITELLITQMNKAYKMIDPDGNLIFNDLFTKRDEVYSGSEETIYHLVKLYALKKISNHSCPIIIDSFRAEDLSTSKENIVIDMYKEFDNQIIFTTTLKDEEIGKYDNNSVLNHIDYKNHVSSKLLQNTYVDEFSSLLQNLSIVNI